MSNDSCYIDTKYLDENTPFSGSFWNQKRVSGDGPPYIKVGSRVAYKWADVEKWLDEHKCSSTSQKPINRGQERPLEEGGA